MTIPWTRAALPDGGLTWLPGQERSGACPAISGGWTRRPLGEGDLLVNADGPEGSGRYWTVTVGLAERAGPAAARAVPDHEHRGLAHAA